MFSAEELPGRDRPAFCREALPAEPFRGALTAHPLGPGSLVTVRSDQATIARGREDIARTARDFHTAYQQLGHGTRPSAPASIVRLSMEGPRPVRGSGPGARWQARELRRRRRGG